MKLEFDTVLSDVLSAADVHWGQQHVLDSQCAERQDETQHSGDGHGALRYDSKPKLSNGRFFIGAHFVWVIEVCNTQDRSAYGLTC